MGVIFHHEQTSWSDINLELDVIIYCPLSSLFLDAKKAAEFKIVKNKQQCTLINVFIDVGSIFFVRIAMAKQNNIYCVETTLRYV